MAFKTDIDWTGSTLPIVTGCTHLLRGCSNCYAALLTGTRLKHNVRYAGLVVDGRFTGEVRVHEDVLMKVLGWREGRKIFVANMGDLFHDGVPTEFIALAMGVFAATRRHTYQLLTKRPKRMKALFNDPVFRAQVYEYAQEYDQHANYDPYRFMMGPGSIQPNNLLIHNEHRDDSDWWPLRNVWVGVSVEDDHTARRVLTLLETPAWCRFVSVEPLVGPVSLRNIHTRGGVFVDALAGDAKTADGVVYAAAPSCLDWVIVGGESGAKATYMHPDWVRALRDECRETSRAFWFKQWGRWSPRGWVGDGATHIGHQAPGELLPIHPSGVDQSRVGYQPFKAMPGKLAGSLLDGRHHKEFPQVDSFDLGMSPPRRRRTGGTAHVR